MSDSRAKYEELKEEGKLTPQQNITLSFDDLSIIVERGIRMTRDYPELSDEQIKNLILIIYKNKL